MKLIINTYVGLRYRHWSISESFYYFLKGVARKLKFKFNFFEELYTKSSKKALSKWEKGSDEGGKCLDIKRVKLVSITISDFDDILSIFCYHNDNYAKQMLREFSVIC